MIKQLLSLATITVSLSANSAIIDLGSITRDTNTGLDWLDVTETRGLSYAAVSAELGPGGTYEGYRFATTAELDQLIMDFGYVAVNTNCDYSALHCDYNVAGDSLIIENMILTLGDTYKAMSDEEGYDIDVDSNGAGYLNGILGSSNRAPGSGFDYAVISDGEFVNRGTDYPYGDAPDVVSSSHGSLGEYEHYTTFGSFLVAPSPVPVPAASWLFLSAIVGLVGKMRLSL